MSDPSDDVLLARLSTLFTHVDPVPGAVVEAARGSLAWRSIDADLARLVADSLQTAGEVRGGDTRLLTFEAGALTLEIEVEARPSGRLRVLGQIVPPATIPVRAEQPGATVSATPDDLGRFAIADLAPGPTRFVSGPVHTDWTIL